MRMYYPDAHLAEHIDTPEQLEHRALRDGFGSAVVEAASRDERIVTLTADVTDSVRLAAFKERFPERHVECGVAEQNMALIASGLAQSIRCRLLRRMRCSARGGTGSKCARASRSRNCP
jgi:Transketolase, C-terminal subunit